MALASSTRVDQRLRLSISTCIRLQNDSIMALSKQSPTEPIDGRRPESTARRVNAQDVNCVPRSWNSTTWWPGNAARRSSPSTVARDASCSSKDESAHDLARSRVTASRKSSSSSRTSSCWAVRCLAGTAATTLRPQSPGYPPPSSRLRRRGADRFVGNVVKPRSSECGCAPRSHPSGRCPRSSGG